MSRLSPDTGFDAQKELLRFIERALLRNVDGPRSAVERKKQRIQIATEIIAEAERVFCAIQPAPSPDTGIDAQLLPCPFCGSPHVSQWAVGRTVQCNTCGAAGPHRESWNAANRPFGNAQQPNRVEATHGDETPDALIAASQAVDAILAPAPPMTVETIEAAFMEWWRTQTIGDDSSDKEIFGQGYIAGWNAKEDQKLPSSETIARAIAKSQGHDPDDLAPSLLMCTADNRQVPWWKVFEEQADACLSVFAPVAQQQDRETLRDIIAHHNACFLPCACLHNPHAGCCAQLADTILGARRETKAERHVTQKCHACNGTGLVEGTMVGCAVCEGKTTLGAVSSNNSDEK